MYEFIVRLKFINIIFMISNFVFVNGLFILLRYVFMVRIIEFKLLLIKKIINIYLCIVY